MDIGKNLQEKGLIRDANLFFVQELLSENHGKINPGIYDLNTSMKSDEMLAIMAAEPEEEKKKEAENSGKADSEEEEDQDAGDAEENGAEGEAE